MVVGERVFYSHALIMFEPDSMDLALLRREYAEGALRRDDLFSDPISQLQAWIEEATNSGETDPTAMTLSTLGERGRISSRVVLLKGIDHTGLRFFTNTQSRKGRQIEAHPQVALHFFWSSLARQVSVEGIAQPLSREAVAGYFAQRPRDSQCGAWASSQSEPVPNRQYLEDAYFHCMERFSGAYDIPVPPDWGGYLVLPSHFEFWQGRPGRLHDRFVYKSDNLGGWGVTRLAP